MGLPWIKVYADLPEHPKSLDLGEALKEPLAWAYIVQLWAWCSRFAQSGLLPRNRVEHAAGWKGKRGAFLDAAEAAGFLDADEHSADHMVVHDWAITQRAHLDKMERDRERRSQERRETVARPSRDARTTVAGESEKEREKKKERQPAAAAAAPVGEVHIPPADKRVSGKELRELWNAVAKPPADLPHWAVMPPAQEMQADLLALEFDRATWQAAFDRIRRSAFLNGHGKSGWLLTPAKLLAKGRPFVTAVLNGEYSGGGDLREEPTQLVRAAEAAPRLQCIAPGCDASAAPGMPCHEHMQMLNDARVPWVTMGQAELVEALGKLEAQAVDALGAPS